MTIDPAIADVLHGSSRYAVVASEALSFLARLPDRSVQLVFFSPPYEGQRLYDEVRFDKTGQMWVDWMRSIICECCWVSNGLVVVNAAGPVEDFRYSPTMEWLVTDLTRLDGIVCGPAPWCWFKADHAEDAPGNGQPGSGAKHYQRRDWEPLYAFCLPGRLPLIGTDNTAFGGKPKYGPGGEFSHRDKKGARANAKKKATCGSKDGDNITLGEYTEPTIANPGNVIRAPVGGGKLGHPLAHEGEAPMSLKVAERIVCWYCPLEVCAACNKPIKHDYEITKVSVVQVQQSQKSGSAILQPSMPKSFHCIESDQAGNSQMPDLPESVQGTFVLESQGQVLQSGMREIGETETTADLSGMPGADTDDQRERGQPVLFQEMCDGMDGSKASPTCRHEEDNKEGLHSGVSTDTSESSGRIRAGTSTGYGKEDRSNPETKRNCSSQKRRKGREPKGKSATDAEAPPRSTSEAQASLDLSELRTHSQACQNCGADLTKSGAITPGIVLDCFCGTGTTAHACKVHGRRFIGCDQRQSQVNISDRRMLSVTPELFRGLS